MKPLTEAGTGKGSIEALYNTLEKMCTTKQLNLLDYRIQSVGAGRDALAQVFVKMSCSGMETSGRGLAQDVLEASAKAYLNAINRVLYLKESSENAIVRIKVCLHQQYYKCIMSREPLHSHCYFFIK